MHPSIKTNDNSIVNDMEKLKISEMETPKCNLMTPPPSEEKNTSSQKSISNHSDHDTKNSDDSSFYIESLKGEREQLTQFTDGFTHVFNLIDKEIKRVSIDVNPQLDSSPSKTSNTNFLSEIIPVPVGLYPNYNFVGRILGPRGTTAKQLETATGCKIIVHGRKRDVITTTDANTGAVTTEAAEPLSIEISCPANVPDAEKRLETGVKVVKDLLIPPADGQDELKRQQLMILANINGTYRPRSNAPNAQHNGGACGDYANQYKNLLQYGYRSPNCHHENPMIRSMNNNNKTPSENMKHDDVESRKEAILKSLIDNKEPAMKYGMRRNMLPYPPVVPNLEDMFNVMQWYEMMNRVRLATSTPFDFSKSRNEMKAQEIGNRMCSSIGSFGIPSSPSPSNYRRSYKHRNGPSTDASTNHRK